MRPAVLQAFLDRAQATMEAPRRPRDVRDVVARVMAACRKSTGQIAAVETAAPAVTVHLEEALRAAGEGPADLADVADALGDLEPLLAWKRRDRPGPGASENFLDGNAYAMILGPGGLEDRDDLWIGVSLLGPTVTYPDHSHPPEEAYLVLSPGSFRQANGEWQHREVDETFHNAPGIVHGMKAGDAPMLALWFLPVR